MPRLVPRRDKEPLNGTGYHGRDRLQTGAGGDGFSWGIVSGGRGATLAQKSGRGGLGTDTRSQGLEEGSARTAVAAVVGKVRMRRPGAPGRSATRAHTGSAAGRQRETGERW